MRTFRLLRRLRRSRDGAAAIEFAILAIPYFLIIFAIIETFVAFLADQVVETAVQTIARQLRTGAITDDATRSTYKSSAQFRAAFCNEISIMLTCDAAELATPKRLWLDVRTFSSFANLPKTVTTKADGSLDTSSFGYDPGGAKSINMVRAFYYWPVTVDLVRPYVANIRLPGATSKSDYLIIATMAFQNEDYP